eukprot:1567722-Rhodomonas_salina.3
MATSSQHKRHSLRRTAVQSVCDMPGTEMAYGDAVDERPASVLRLTECMLVPGLFGFTDDQPFVGAETGKVPTYPPTHLPTYPPTYLSTHPPTHLSGCSPTYQPTSGPTHKLHPRKCVCLYIMRCTC